ncbi:hypothetical protein WJX72_003543 [[Myrmecia] bisecta]|uniref:Dynein light chain n=1 Tax=[Myrmecia] bisecta TaxID=41462 RepID=A0AAW1Q6W2_9CHLO
MPSEYEQTAIEVCLQGVHKYKHYKDVAAYIKHEYDRKYPSSGKATEGVYHCVCGKNFACAVSHETRYYIHLQIDTLHIILFKSKDNPFAVSEG